LSDGSYLLNFKGCGGCGKRDFIKNIDRSEDNNEEETEQVRWKFEQFRV